MLQSRVVSGNYERATNNGVAFRARWKRVVVRGFFTFLYLYISVSIPSTEHDTGEDEHFFWREKNMTMR
jgi:hypothetical protein